MTKKCTKCLQDRLLGDFSPDPRYAHGVKAWCKKCYNDWNKANYDPEAHRANKLWHKYRLRIAEYAQKLEEQANCCAICGTRLRTEVARTIAERHQTARVDHDHACCQGDRSCGGCVRGLLCERCNRAIGQFNDNPAVLRAAAEYIEMWKS